MEQIRKFLRDKGFALALLACLVAAAAAGVWAVRTVRDELKENLDGLKTPDSGIFCQRQGIIIIIVSLFLTKIWSFKYFRKKDEIGSVEAASRTIVSALSIFSCTWLQHENCSAAIFIFLIICFLFSLPESAG